MFKKQSHLFLIRLKPHLLPCQWCAHIRAVISDPVFHSLVVRPWMSWSRHAVEKGPMPWVTKWHESLPPLPLSRTQKSGPRESEGMGALLQQEEDTEVAGLSGLHRSRCLTGNSPTHKPEERSLAAKDKVDALNRSAKSVLHSALEPGIKFPNFVLFYVTLFNSLEEMNFSCLYLKRSFLNVSAFCFHKFPTAKGCPLCRRLGQAGSAKE